MSLCKNTRLNKWEKTPSKPLELQCFMNVAVLFQNNLVFFNVELNRGHLLLSALETTHQLLGLKKYFPNLIRSMFLRFKKILSNSKSQKLEMDLSLMYIRYLK